MPTQREKSLENQLLGSQVVRIFRAAFDSSILGRGGLPTILNGVEVSSLGSDTIISLWISHVNGMETKPLDNLKKHIEKAIIASGMGDLLTGYNIGKSITRETSLLSRGRLSTTPETDSLGAYRIDLERSGRDGICLEIRPFMKAGKLLVKNEDLLEWEKAMSRDIIDDRHEIPSFPLSSLIENPVTDISRGTVIREDNDIWPVGLGKVLSSESIQVLDWWVFESSLGNRFSANEVTTRLDGDFYGSCGKKDRLEVLCYSKTAVSVEYEKNLPSVFGLGGYTEKNLITLDDALKFYCLSTGERLACVMKIKLEARNHEDQNMPDYTDIISRLERAVAYIEDQAIKANQGSPGYITSE